MPLTVAIQMDPIEKIDIAGDSTFALALEAQARGHTLLYYGPRDLTFRDGKVTARVRPLQRARRRRAITSRSGEAIRIRPVRRRRRADAPGPALRHGLHHRDACAGAHPSEDPGGQRSGPCAQRAGEALRHRVQGPDAADADHLATAPRSTPSAPSTRTSSSSRSTAMAAPASSACKPDDENLGCAARDVHRRSTASR